VLKEISVVEQRYQAVQADHRPKPGHVIAGEPGALPAARGPVRHRSVCLYSPSADPSGMGSHMLDLAAEYLTDSDVSLMLWETVAGQRLLHRAAALGVRTVGLPRPRDPAFGEVVVDHLRAHPAEVFHIHVGTGRENFEGARAARRAGVPAVVQTQHLPWLLRHTNKRLALFRGLRPVDSVIAVSEGVRRTYERIGVPAERLTTVPNGIRARGRGLGRGPARAPARLGRGPGPVRVRGLGSRSAPW